MNQENYVSTEGLKEIANNINTKRDEIATLYKNSITKVLTESKDAISISGINFDEFLSKFGKTFETLDTRLGELSNVLVNQIIPNYDEINVQIKQIFNQDFANQMNDILNKL